MARPVTAKINKAVTYYTAAGLPKAAVVTAVAGNVVSLRIGHAATLVTKSLGNRNPFSVRTDCWMVK